jgi:serine/threonine protein kinase
MFQQGQQIGSYTLIRKLGRGGFGEVWLAEKRAKFVTTKVAVKLPHDDQIDHEAIKQEAMLWERASGHPNILPIIDADEYDGQVLIVSEFAPDGSLDEWLKQNGKMSVEKAVETTIKILDGLEFLHSRNIIHRDLKPANILLQGDTPRLADFGISRALRTTVASQSQHISGTFAYMSPEALDGKRSVQTDIWSVGVNLYQFLTGNLPYPQAEPSTLIAAIMMREFELLPDWIPADLKNVVAKALAKFPENRYSSAAEMREDLKRVWFNIQHPSVAKTEVLQIPALNNTITDVTNIHQLLQTEEPKKENITQASQTPIVTTPQNETVIPKPQIPFVTDPQIQKDSAATNFKQEYKTSPNQLPKNIFPISGIILGVAALGLIAATAIGIAIYSFRNSNRSLISNNSNISFNSNTATNSLANSNTQSNNLSNPPVADGRLIPYRKGDKWGFSDSTKKIIIEPKFENAEPFAEDLANVKLNGKWGYIDKNGNEIIPFKYDSAEPFKDGVAMIYVIKGSQEMRYCCYGIIDKTGKEIAPPKFTSASNFSEGLAVVDSPASMWKSGYIDTTGKVVIPTNYADTEDFSEDLACVGFDPDIDKNMARGYINTEKYGFIDKTGKVVIPFKYWRAKSFSEGLAPVAPPDDKLGWGYIDKSGNKVIDFRYEAAGGFNNGFAPVKLERDGKWGFIDKTGKEIIPFKYDYALDVVQGLAPVKLNGKWGFVDKTDKEVIPIKYDDDFPRFSKITGLAKVKLNGKQFYIDKNGTEYYEP